MNFADFSRRFSQQQEIGRDLTDERLSVYFDNGQEVGVWREDRRTTIGQGEVLGDQTAELARHWYRRPAAERNRPAGRGR